MAENSPGPWHLRGPENQYDEYTSILGSPADPEDMAIAFLPRSYDEEQKANAQLIAAAPSLLAACEEALEFLELFQRAHNARLADHLRSAIAMATGQEVPA